MIGAVQDLFDRTIGVVYGEFQQGLSLLLRPQAV